MSKVQLGAERTPHDLGRLVFTCGDIGRLKVVDATPVFPGDSYECNMVGALRLSPLRRGLAVDSKWDVISFYIPHRHTYGEDWMDFLRDGLSGTKLLPSVPTRAENWAGGAFGAVPNTTNYRLPKWLVEGYCRIYENYFVLPELINKDTGQFLSRDLLNWSYEDLAHGISVQHLKNVWTASLPSILETKKFVDTSGGLDIMSLNASYGALHTEQERDLFMQRYRDVVQNFGGSTSYDADQRPHMLMRSEFWASGYDVDGTDQSSLGQFSGRVSQSLNHRVPRFFVPEHGAIITVMVGRFPPIHQRATPYYIGNPDYSYTDFAGDPAISGNIQPRDIPISSIFREGSISSTLRLAQDQWFRSIPDFVDERYGDAEGFPFLNNMVSNNHDATRIWPSSYDQCFQTMQLRHWNAQIKTNVSVLRALPAARESILTSA